MIGYQVEELSHTLLVSILLHDHAFTLGSWERCQHCHFQLETGCENYFLLNQSVAHFKHGLDSILTNYVKSPEINPSFDGPDVIPSVEYLAVLKITPIYSYMHTYC